MSTYVQRDGRRTAGGQALVLVVLALVGLMAMAGLIVDGGNAYAQQRMAQNAADAAADAGATVLAQNLVPSPTASDPDVAQAVDTTLEANHLAGLASLTDAPAGAPCPAEMTCAYYTDITGTLLTSAGVPTTAETQAARVGGGVIPACGAGAICPSPPINATAGVVARASGVRVVSAKPFSTTFAGVVGISNLTASAGATAVSGYVENPAILPVTFSVNQTACDSSGDAVDLSTPWFIPDAPATYDSTNEVTLAICKNEPGGVGWLDLVPAPENIADEIRSPSAGPYYPPTWLQTQSGNVNALDNELSAYWGDVVGTYEPGLDQLVLIPMFNLTCFSPADSSHPDGLDPRIPPFIPTCSRDANGDNTSYHIPFFIAFVLDRTYTSASNRADCNAEPGTPTLTKSDGTTVPLIDGNGGNGCFKGWFAKGLYAGSKVGIDPGAGPARPVSVQLIR